MARERSPNRDKAFEIWKENNGSIELVDIAAQLNLPAGTIRGWKNKDRWEERLNGTFQKNTERSEKKKSPQNLDKSKKRSGNLNPTHKFPKHNSYAETHGFFSKYLPEETLAIMEEIQQKDPLDILWENITIQYTAIVRAQRIMYVRDKDDKTSTKIGESYGDASWSEKWEVQYAWDRQANFLQAQSKAMATLQTMLKRYEEMTQSGLATEEQKLRVEKLKVEIDKIKDGDKDKPIEVVIKRAEKRASDGEGS
ncbi:MAG: phage terminase small subunit [Desulfitobacterium sp.]